MSCRTFVLLLLLQAPTLASADSPVLTVDPLRVGSLPMGTLLMQPLDDEGSQLTVALSYVSTISGSWHTGTIHEELGRNGQPIAPWELALLEQRHPTDEIFRLDIEGWQAMMRWTTRLTERVDLGIEVPWITYGQPHWDTVSEKFHELFGIGPNERHQFPKGVTLVYAHSPEGRAEYREEDLARSGWGDLRVAVGAQLGRWLGAGHRLVATLEAPTGTATPLHGSGGWDVAVRWFGSWQIGAVQLAAGAGYTWLDPAGDWLSFERSNTHHAALIVSAPMTAALELEAALRRETSPLADAFPDSRLGEPATTLNLGIRWSLGHSSWVSFALGENFAKHGVAPDYSLHLATGFRFDRR